MAVYAFTAIVLLGISFLFYCLRRFGGEIRQYVIRRRSAFAGINKILLWWNSRELELLATIFGVMLCSIIAALLCVFFQKSSFKDVLPIYFLLLIMVVAVCFGYLAGVLGTILSGLMFAAFFFEPLRSLAVKSSEGRNNLIWMVLGGLALSQLFGKPSKDGKAKKT